jgi:hypothetical protein
MILVFGDCLINMDKVATIRVTDKYDDGTLNIFIRTTSIVEWHMHQPGIGPGFSPLEMEFRIKEKTWSDLIKALKNDESVFIPE